MSSEAHEFPFANYFLFIGVAFLALPRPVSCSCASAATTTLGPIFTFDAVAESRVRQCRHSGRGTAFRASPLPRRPRVLHRRDQHRDSFMSLYTVNVAISTGLTKEAGEAKAKLVLMVAITAAILGGITWGFIVDRIGPKQTLNIVLAGWISRSSARLRIGFLHLTIIWLFIVACAAGICLGGTWASDRPLMLRLTPPDRVGEFYGLVWMVGRFSAV